MLDLSRPDGPSGLEIAMALQRNFCRNLNHGRRNVPVRFCVMCGEIVNRDIPIKKCEEGEHALKRRSRNTYCMDCGVQLIQT